MDRRGKHDRKFKNAVVMLGGYTSLLEIPESSVALPSISLLLSRSFTSK